MIRTNPKGQFNWRLPINVPWTGLVITAGPLRGPVLTAHHSRLTFGGTLLPWADRTGTIPSATASGTPLLATRSTQGNFQPGTVTALVDMRDVMPSAQGERLVALHAIIRTKNGTQVRTIHLDIHQADVTGDVEGVLNEDSVTLLIHDLTPGVILLAVERAGTWTKHPAPTLPGLLSLSGTTSPSTVVAFDAWGNASGNILTGLTDARALRAGTPLSPWSFDGKELNPQKPNLAALLKAFEAALDLKPELAGNALSLKRAVSDQLTALAAEFGLTRRAGEGDRELRSRALNRIQPGQASAPGLRARLAREGMPGAIILDEESTYPEMRTLDGTWTLDGSVMLGGPARGPHLSPGEVLIAYTNTPARGWAAVEEATRTKAAGVKRVFALLIETQSGPTGAQAIHAGLHYPHAQAFSTAIVRRATTLLTLDGTWTLDGSMSLDGTRPLYITYH